MPQRGVPPQPCVVAGRTERLAGNGYGRVMRTSSRVAFAVAWCVYATAVVLAWRKVLAVPDGRGDITGLFVATVCGAAGLVLLRAWLQEHERSE